jgi:hypothetical protein
MADESPSNFSKPKDLKNETASAPPRVRIHLLCSDIARAGEGGMPADEIPVDAIAVGHYQDVVPVNAERALDQAISGKLPGEGDEGLIITQFTERQIITGEVARPFFLPDPRRPERLIAIVGMGYPRKFSVPELTALVRQLCWSLGYLGRKHLATVLIGAGDGNIDVEDAVDAWLRGLSIAIEEAARTGRHLEALTFVELYPPRLDQIHQALYKRAKDLGGVEVESRLISEPGPSGPEPPPSGRREVEPGYVTAEMTKRTFGFATLGPGSTTLFQRSTTDPDLIFQANNKLIDAPSKTDQLERGETLHGLLFPAALWDHLPLGAPLVMNCDPRAARITWEMLAEPVDPHIRGTLTSSQDRFLGLARGLTRQLRVEAESAVSSREPGDILKVLIVADPARDKPLTAARQEGEEIAKLFEEYNARTVEHARNAIKRKVLLAEKATWDAVMTELQSESYDVFHFVGHCRYDPKAPERSGMVFSDDKVLTPGALSQLRRVPSYVFANGCYSGLVPSSQRQLSAKLTPSLAAAFLRGGVANLVCAAWEVNSKAALVFAVTLYTNLLGLDGPSQPMHVAMRRARIAVWNEDNGLHTWGAYQHYGNPYFRFFRASP